MPRRPPKDKRDNRPAAAPALLDEYSAKRTFDATPEPAPSVVERRNGPLLFVIQKHDARQLHYDFRLECDGVLKSWAVPKGPSLNPADKRMAVHVEDHPYDYASFEGVIPPGQYGAGEVIVWDCGVYSPDEDHLYWFHDVAEAQRRIREGIEKGKLSILLRGEKLKGSFALVRTSDKKSWLLIKHKDAFTAQTDVTEQDRSVLSGVTVSALKTLRVRRIPAEQLIPGGTIEPMPKTLSPMLAEIGTAVSNRADWMWEPKLDGYRVLAFITKEGVKLRSRRALDLTPAFPRLAAELGRQAVDSMILDGEIVAFDAEGRPSFSVLANRARLTSPRDIATADRSGQTVFYCFDLLHFAGVDLRGTPYKDRKRYLAQCLLPSPLVRLVQSWEDGVALNEAALENGFEGVVGKRLDSIYQPGRRSPSWVKVKSGNSAEFVIGGYTKGKGSRQALGSVLVGYWDEGKLRFASHVGSGFDEATLVRLKKQLEPLRRDACPFVEEPELHSPTQWVEPVLVVEVTFQSWTDQGHLRAPVLLRTREDVDPKTVKRAGAGVSARAAGPSSDRGTGNAEIDDVLRQLDNNKPAFALAVGPHRIRLTNLAKVYWPADPQLKQPAVTKRELLRYLAKISPVMLPHLADRPLTMIRMPEGIQGHRFFQKHWDQERPEFAETITVFSEHKDERHDYLLCNNLPTLLWLAQVGSLEFHVWHSRARPGPDAPKLGTDYSGSLASLESSVLNYPDYLVFDLDPYIYSGKEAPGEEPELNTVAFEKGKETAFRLRELLSSMSLESIVKTSGKTGLHVFVQINRTLDFDAARRVCEIVGRHLVRQRPKDITMEWSVPKRTGRIFLDYNMNVRGKTLNVAYSPRGAAGAPVSMPLTWDELAGAHPLDFTITSVLRRQDRIEDRWRHALKRKQSLEGLLNQASPDKKRR